MVTPLFRSVFEQIVFRAVLILYFVSMRVWKVRAWTTNRSAAQMA